MVWENHPMSRLPFFVASCPNCSTKKQLELSALGRQADCVACGKSFQAHGPDSTSAALEDPVHYWINFTDHEMIPCDSFSQDAKDLGRTPR
jgi:hypothetical protein